MVNRPDKKEAVMDARSVSPKSADDDLNYEINLRPRGFDEYIGQEQVKENLRRRAGPSLVSWSAGIG